MQDFEKLGAFYLGKAYDLDADALRDDLVLYDAKDLTTHAVIIGMTGSGKTGLGISLLEEAALDHIPVIAIDPKGDLGNLLLTFPKLAAADFAPWVNARTAADQGMSVDAFAKAQSELWRKGLAQWGQDGARIARLRESAELAIYTPGSNAGIPVSVLRAFDAPAEALRADRDLYRERIQATATGILALLGIDADPITSREHILLSTILGASWDKGESLDLGGLIHAVQQPPVRRIGVMDLDSVYPERDRFALAMQLNNLLAAPGFEVWMEGEALDAGRLLYNETGKPRVSIMSIAHLSDAERMFFVSMLLNEIVSWMRAQPGTGTLRAILYMDEIFGYMPPVANPPSKQMFLTLLKQARAYGLGLVLATQNPVDLDYKGLSNTGTWFIGRLQTERDKARVLEGLEGAAVGGAFDKGRMGQILAGLGKRRFLLHNVHEDGPVVFNTRWAMSYLSGPFTREQIKTLKADSALSAPPAAAAKPAASAKAVAGAKKARSTPPVISSKVQQYYLPLVRRPGEGSLVYHPLVLAAVDVGYSSVRYKVNESKRVLYACEVEDGPVPLDWADAEALDIDPDLLEQVARDDADFAGCPDPATDAKNYTQWKKTLSRWIRTTQPLTLYKCASLKMYSRPDEAEREFRIRLQEAANEARDIAVAKLRKKYASRTNTLENRLQRAEHTIERESQQAKQKKFDTAVAFGTAILGAVLGRKKVSTSSASRMGSAMKSAGRMRKETGDVERAKETMETVRVQLEELAARLEQEVAELETALDGQAEELEEVLVKAKSTEIHVHFVGLGWAPHVRTESGLTPAYV